MCVLYYDGIVSWFITLALDKVESVTVVFARLVFFFFDMNMPWLMQRELSYLGHLKLQPCNFFYLDGLIFFKIIKYI